MAILSGRSLSPTVSWWVIHAVLIYFGDGGGCFVFLWLSGGRNWNVTMFDGVCFWGFVGLDGQCEAAGDGARAEHSREVAEWASNSCWTACNW